MGTFLTPLSKSATTQRPDASLGPGTGGLVPLELEPVSLQLLPESLSELDSESVLVSLSVSPALGTTPESRTVLSS